MKHEMREVIIVNFNSTDALLRCLQSMRDSISLGFVKVIVQDNCSSDGVERVNGAYPEVSVNRNQRNIGFAHAVNKSLKTSNAPYVVLLNPDTVVLDGFFTSTFNYMDANPQVGVLGPAILNSDGTVQGSARAFPGFLTALFGRNSPLSRLLPGNPITRANVVNRGSDGVTPLEVDWVSGACMVVRRKAMDEVGLLDPRFFLYWEDADWCRRMWKKGWKVVYLPSAKVVHYVGASSSTRPIFSLYEFHKSAYKLFNKHARLAYRIMSPLVAFGLAMRFGLVVALRSLGGRGRGKSVT